MDDSTKTIKFHYPKPNSVRFVYSILKSGLFQQYVEEESRRKDIQLMSEQPPLQNVRPMRNYRLRQASEIYAK